MVPISPFPTDKDGPLGSSALTHEHPSEEDDEGWGTSSGRGGIRSFSTLADSPASSAPTIVSLCHLHESPRPLVLT